MFLVPIKIDNEYEYCIYGKYESKGQLTLYLKEGNNPKKVDLIHMKTTGKFSWIKVNTVVINKNDGSKHIVGILEDYIEGFIKICENLNIKVVAEGIETEEQINYLKKVNCELVQGFIFSKAIDVSTFEKNFLEKGGE